MPQTRAEKDVLMAGMIAMALGRNMTWAQIGSALGWGSGREAKRKAHQLRRRTEARLRQQAVSAQIAGGRRWLTTCTASSPRCRPKIRPRWRN